MNNLHGLYKQNSTVYAKTVPGAMQGPNIATAECKFPCMVASTPMQPRLGGPLRILKESWI